LFPPPLAYWVHDLDPFLIRFHGDIGIRYYGLAYVLGFYGGWMLLRAAARAGRSPVKGEALDDLIFAVVVGVLVGGRLGSFLLYDGWRKFLDDPLSLLRVWEGGMASHGGFIGVILALVWFSRRRKIPFFQLGDLIVSVVPLGLLLGRLANFINGELWGKPATVPWAVIFLNTGGGPMPRHPSQLYEAALEGALLLAWVQWRFWRTDVIRRQPGRLAGEFLTGYALVRMVGELFREPDASLILGLSRGTFYSVFVLIAGVALVVLAPKVKLAPSQNRSS
jgi:phosphatidylglycerol:prolipoprotein diacylglycerol transferase